MKKIDDKVIVKTDTYVEGIIEEILINKNCILYKIRVSDELISRTEDDIFESMPIDNTSKFMLLPIMMNTGTDIVYNTFRVFKILDCKVSILRLGNEACCLDFDLELIGNIDSKLIEHKLRIEDKLFLTYNKYDFLEVMVEFNNNLDTYLPHIKLDQQSEKTFINHRTIYDPIIDSIILYVKPNINTYIQQIDRKSSFGEMFDHYAVSDKQKYVYTTLYSGLPATINIYGIDWHWEGTFVESFEPNYPDIFPTIIQYKIDELILKHPYSKLNKMVDYILEHCED